MHVKGLQIISNMKKILFILATIVLMASCTSSLPAQFDNIADKVEKNGASYSTEQWDKVNAEYDKLVEKYNQDADKLSDEQKKEINSAMGRYQAAVLKAGLKGFGEALDGALEGAKGFIEGLTRE